MSDAPDSQRAKAISDALFAKWVGDPDNDGGYVLMLNAERTEELFSDITRWFKSELTALQSANAELREENRKLREWLKSAGEDLAADAEAMRADDIKNNPR